MKSAIVLGCLLLSLTGCVASSADSMFFGTTDPPEGQVLRYVSGSEPQSLDPHVGTGQPEGRIYMALFEGLIEYDPKTAGPIPAIAESWEANPDNSEFVFHLRRNARFSNGDAITAHDFVWSLRRAAAPEFAALNAYMAYPVLYLQAFNEKGSFVRTTATGEFDTDPATGHRVTVAADATAPAGKELVPVRAEDIGIEAIDDYTVRYRLGISAPYFVGMMAHQFFKVIHRPTVERYGDANWTQPENIVTSGPFKVKEWVPFDKLVVERDPLYWDAAAVRLDEIRFYPLDSQTTMMNLYKSGAVDALYNHTTPVAWLDFIQPLKDYMGAPEMANYYVQINTTRAPMNDVRVRRAFSLAVDREAVARFRRVATPLYAFVPTGIFPGYPQPMGDGFDPERAKALLAEAGFRDANGNYDPTMFPANEVEYVYNTSEINRQIAELVQAQWKQNLGITVSLRNMEFGTFLVTRANLEYKGFSRSGWIGDYLDPFSYLELFSTREGNNGTGWWDRRYADLLDEANRTVDPMERYQKMAEAEKLLLDSAAIISLYTNSTDWMKKPYVKGMYPNPATMHPWKFVYIEHDPANWDYGVPDMTP